MTHLLLKTSITVHCSWGLSLTQPCMQALTGQNTALIEFGIARSFANSVLRGGEQVWTHLLTFLPYLYSCS